MDFAALRLKAATLASATPAKMAGTEDSASRAATLERAKALAAAARERVANLPSLANPIANLSQYPIPPQRNEATPTVDVLFNAAGKAIDRKTGMIIAENDSRLIQLNSTSNTTKSKLTSTDQGLTKSSKPKSAVPETVEPVSKFYDQSLGSAVKYRNLTHIPSNRATGRSMSMFNLVKPGTHVKESQALRLARAELDIRRSREEEAVESTILDLACLKTASSPKVEWWDEPILLAKPQCSKEYPEYHDLRTVVHSFQTMSKAEKRSVSLCLSALGTLKGILHSDAISSLIHVPKRIPSVIPPSATITTDIILTKAERRKKRRLERLTANQEQQDLIRAGLIQPNPPKLKINNFMRVLGEFAAINPTEAESMARTQIQERRDKHDEMNHSRMLTKEQRGDKLRKKLDESTDEGVVVSVFRIGDMRSGKTRFKIQTNAEQYNLTGVALLNPACNLVIVEGGEKNMKKYSALLLRRIKWDQVKEEADAEAHEAMIQASNDLNKTNLPGDINIQQERFVEEDHTTTSTASNVGASPHNQCDLVWSGVLHQRNFQGFRTEMISSKIHARKFLERSGAAQYWDLALKYEPPKKNI